MRDFAPIPDPSGALQPPNRRPPTAVGADASGPAPRPAPRPSIPHREPPSRLERALEVVLAVPLLAVGAVLYPFTRRAAPRLASRSNGRPMTVVGAAAAVPVRRSRTRARLCAVIMVGVAFLGF